MLKHATEDEDQQLHLFFIMIVYVTHYLNTTGMRWRISMFSAMILPIYGINMKVFYKDIAVFSEHFERSSFHTLRLIY